MVRAVTVSLILIGLIYNTAHNSLVTQLLASCVKDFHLDFSLLICSLQMWILPVGTANTSQGHPVSNFCNRAYSVF
jgi:chemotaxis receptor (MCP) glutamine deamidase CheD